MRDKLPEGWTTVPLTDVSTSIQYGYTASAQPSGNGPRFLRITDIQDGKVNWASVPSCKIERSELAKYRLRPGDIVFARSGATTGKSFLIDECPDNAVFASYLIRVRVQDAVLNPRYLSLAFQTPEYWSYITNNMAGNAQPNCNGSKLAPLPVAIAPLAEQCRIVAKVEALLEQVSRAKARLDRVLLIPKRFRQAVLAAACSGRITEEWRRSNLLRRPDVADDERALGDCRPADLPELWSWTSLAAIAMRVTDGTHQPPPLVQHGIPFVLIGNIKRGRVIWDDVSKWVTDETYAQLTSRCCPQRGDVLYTAVGATYGQALVVDWDHRFVFQRHIAHIKPNRDLVNTDYLAIALNAPSTYALATEMARGAAQPTVTLGDMKRFPIPLPPLEEQAEIVQRVRRLLVVAQAVERRTAHAVRCSDALLHSILSKAFSGELVPTEAELARQEGRDYEPASLLLQRTMERRAVTAPDKRKRRTGKARRAASRATPV